MVPIPLGVAEGLELPVASIFSRSGCMPSQVGAEVDLPNPALPASTANHVVSSHGGATLLRLKDLFEEVT